MVEYRKGNEVNMNPEHIHEWYLDEEVVPPLPKNEDDLVYRSIFIECLGCGLIYRDEEILMVWDKLYKPIGECPACRENMLHRLVCMNCKKCERCCSCQDDYMIEPKEFMKGD